MIIPMTLVNMQESKECAGALCGDMPQASFAHFIDTNKKLSGVQFAVHCTKALKCTF